MDLVWTLIIGLLVGAGAKFLMPGKDPGGLIMTILLGIAGSFVASLLGREFGLYAKGAAAGLVMSVAGAMLLLLVYRLIRRAA
jgi:uncharacterized membrane protein YeaQ/YmgE (transglycosylase-associated protein family)